MTTAVASSLGVHSVRRGSGFCDPSRPVGNFVCSFDPLLFSGHGPRLGSRTGGRGDPDPLHFGRGARKAVAPCCAVPEDWKRADVGVGAAAEGGIGLEGAVALGASAARVAERQARKKAQRYTYLAGAVMSSVGITSLAVAAVGSRFFWQLDGAEVPLTETLSTFALAVSAVVGMEFWARWAHRELWHNTLWSMHESHHRPRDGPFELNDIFAIVNAVPAISLISYGFSNRGLLPGLCFGAGIGITLYGMAYMIIHDGLGHRRLPVGPLGNVPYLRRVVAAHQIHHSGKLDGVPFGLFLGPEEVEEVGGTEELQKEINRRIASARV
ncbi:hypothetical protein Taro_007014 [Colocasia esculenta]|uniref:beta-carotene 3-hydroxylase n=1 Tax=Colocasia esculenta TaxID=4460 RepID=A0A843TWY0_COLES|nr:hypothetical protein [Colocasia esculenta]